MADLMRLLLTMYVLSCIFGISQTMLGLGATPILLCLARKANARIWVLIAWHATLTLAFAAVSAMVAVGMWREVDLGWWRYPVCFMFFLFLLGSHCTTRFRVGEDPEAETIGGAAILVGLFGFVAFCALPNLLLNNSASTACARWATWFLDGWWTRGWTGVILGSFVLWRFGLFALSAGLGSAFVLVAIPISAIAEARKNRVGSRRGNAITCRLPPTTATPRPKTASGASRPDQAAAQSAADAMRVALAHYHETGGAVQDYAKAMVYFRKAADDGNAPAMYYIAALYEIGRGVPSDCQQAMAWYLKAADAGDAPAMTRAGFLYEHGRGVAQDYQRALAWYRKAADAGNPDAMTSIGFLYCRGHGVAKDYEQAMYWFRQAAYVGNAEAMAYIGLLYEHGCGVPKNLEEAVVWHRKAAEGRNAMAMMKMGVLYEIGQGVPQDYEQAMAWHRAAAEAGEAAALTSIGFMYCNGLGVAKDYDVALDWYRKAADAGNAEAMRHIADMYANGDGVPEDREQAKAWYRKAADAGDAVATFFCGPRAVA
jgi:TPR repeat protein